MFFHLSKNQNDIGGVLRKTHMDQKVAVVPGTAFGSCGEGFIRCSYAYSIENINEALKRIGNFIKKL